MQDSVSPLLGLAHQCLVLLITLIRLTLTVRFFANSTSHGVNREASILVHLYIFFNCGFCSNANTSGDTHRFAKVTECSRVCGRVCPTEAPPSGGCITTDVFSTTRSSMNSLTVVLQYMK